MKFTTLEGNQIYYSIYGSGSVVILLHGFAETSKMWDIIIPYLRDKFTVITIDLPGIGLSSIMSDNRGQEMNIILAAVQIHDLILSLGIDNIRMVGHDIGLMVAYAYTALFSLEVSKLVLMDAFLPINSQYQDTANQFGDWRKIYDDPKTWHFRFSGSIPEALIKGREDIYFSFFWNDLAFNPNKSISILDRQIYLENYSRPGRMNAAWKYFESFPVTASDFEELSKTKLNMPVLSLAGDKSMGLVLGQQVELIANNYKNVIITSSGHWILEEQPEQTINALVNFL